MRRWVLVGALSMAVAVALGAFGAHALRDVFDSKQMEWWHTAQEYQVWHALALVVAGLIEGQTGRSMRAVAWLFVAGTLVFSGSLYLMALTGQTWLGAITPFGGAAFIAGWITLAVVVAQRKD